ARHLVGEEVVDRGQELEDDVVVVRVRDVLRQETAEQVAVRVAHREVRGPLELQALRLEGDRVDRVGRQRGRDRHVLRKRARRNHQRMGTDGEGATPRADRGGGRLLGQGRALEQAETLQQATEQVVLRTDRDFRSCTRGRLIGGDAERALFGAAGEDEHQGRGQQKARGLHTTLQIGGGLTTCAYR